eukprot:TRINITY_DN54280_c0_g1_i2.p1 TRINITY_DN54280_c0_g1~~TRINITY_DN54280_c0_g1_i2.p1  ORF type:complete len:340 (+),score=31.08 TRINITY_DN54280_c0_g1_i2:166-1185(+)
MLRSLVGSEMCIRDSHMNHVPQQALLRCSCDASVLSMDCRDCEHQWAAFIESSQDDNGYSYWDPDVDMHTLPNFRNHRGARLEAKTVLGLGFTCVGLLGVNGILAGVAVNANDDGPHRSLLARLGMATAMVVWVLLTAAWARYKDSGAGFPQSWTRISDCTWGLSPCDANGGGSGVRYGVSFVFVLVIWGCMLPYVLLWAYTAKVSIIQSWTEGVHPTFYATRMCTCFVNRCCCLVDSSNLVPTTGQDEHDDQVDLEGMSLLDTDQMSALWQDGCPRIALDRFQTVLFKEGYTSTDDLVELEPQEFDRLFREQLRLKAPEIQRIRAKLQRLAIAMDTQP